MLVPNIVFIAKSIRQKKVISKSLGVFKMYSSVWYVYSNFYENPLEAPSTLSLSTICQIQYRKFLI